MISRCEHEGCKWKSKAHGKNGAMALRSHVTKFHAEAPTNGKPKKNRRKSAALKPQQMPVVQDNGKELVRDLIPLLAEVNRRMNIYLLRDTEVPVES